MRKYTVATKQMPNRADSSKSRAEGFSRPPMSAQMILVTVRPMVLKNRLVSFEVNRRVYSLFTTLRMVKDREERMKYSISKNSSPNEPQASLTS